MKPKFYSLKDQAHYVKFPIQPIEIIEMYNLNWREGNAVKYILRARHKSQRTTDIKKAIWYLERELDLIEEELVIFNKTICDTSGFERIDEE